MAKTKKVPAVVLTDEEIAKLSKALNRTWEAIAYDVMQMTKKPLRQSEMLDATGDYIDMYGKDKEATELLYKPGVYAAARKAIKRLFPYERYSL
jgi:hypothetical protein